MRRHVARARPPRRRDHHRRRERPSARGRGACRRDARRARRVRVRRRRSRAGASVVAVAIVDRRRLRSRRPRSRTGTRARHRTRARAGSRARRQLPLLPSGKLDRRAIAALPTVDRRLRCVVGSRRGDAVSRRRGARRVQARGRDDRERSAVEVVVAVRRASGDVSPRERRSSARSSRSPGSRRCCSPSTRSGSPRSSSIRSSSALLAGALVELLPQVKRGLTPRARLPREVRRAARATFVERGVHATTGRSGVLVYISWLEQEIALVADLVLATLAARRRARDRRGRADRDDAAAAAPRSPRARRSSPTQMGVAMPHRDDDVNELPDAIDSDMESTMKRRAHDSRSWLR